MQININIVLVSLIDFKHFNSDIDKLAISLLRYIMDSLYINNTVGLALLIIIVFNKYCNLIIFNIVLSLLTRLLKCYYSLVVSLDFNSKDQPFIIYHCLPINIYNNTDTKYQDNSSKNNNKESTQHRDNNNNKNNKEKAQCFNRVYLIDNTIASR
jgi:hypothetical protein